MTLRLIAKALRVRPRDLLTEDADSSGSGPSYRSLR
jgi:hypothetical protein